MPDIQNIIFDYGNVLYKIDFNLTITAFEKLGISNVAAVFGHLTQSSIFDDFDRGIITPVAFIEALRGLSTIPINNTDIINAWNALLIGIPEYRIELLYQVKKKYPIYLLSNNNALHYQEILNFLDAHDYPRMESIFNATYYSQRTGLRKPEKAIFQLVLDEQKIKAEHTLFIDDSPQHIKTAKEMGFKTLYLKDFDHLETELQKLGII